MTISVCEHVVGDMNQAHTVHCKEYDFTGKKSILYKTLCSDCFYLYKQYNLVFSNYDDAENWLNNEYEV